MIMYYYSKCSQSLHQLLHYAFSFWNGPVPEQKKVSYRKFIGRHALVKARGRRRKLFATRLSKTKMARLNEDNTVDFPLPESPQPTKNEMREMRAEMAKLVKALGERETPP